MLEAHVNRGLKGSVDELVTSHFIAQIGLAARGLPRCTCQRRKLANEVLFATRKEMSTNFTKTGDGLVRTGQNAHSQPKLRPYIQTLLDIYGPVEG